MADDENIKKSGLSDEEQKAAGRRAMRQNMALLAQKKALDALMAIDPEQLETKDIKALLKAGADLEQQKEAAVPRQLSEQAEAVQALFAAVWRGPMR